MPYARTYEYPRISQRGFVVDPPTYWVFAFSVVFLLLDLNLLCPEKCAMFCKGARVPARVCACSRVCECLSANLNNDSDINAPFCTVAAPFCVSAAAPGI